MLIILDEPSLPLFAFILVWLLPGFSVPRTLLPGERLVSAKFTLFVRVGASSLFCLTRVFRRRLRKAS